MDNIQIDAAELIKALGEHIANLTQENLTLKLYIGKIGSGGNKPQE